MTPIKILSFFLIASIGNYNLYAQSNAIVFGSELNLTQISPGKKNKENSINWINVNTNADTWKKNKDVLICAGQPIGVMRSEKE